VSPAGEAFRIAVDTGGTFTDVVISGATGRVAAGKSLTTPERVFDGFHAAVDRAARDLGSTAEDVLGRASVIVYGTTHATNAVITGATARTALLITEGFADTLVFREGGRRDVFDTTAAYPAPYVPRRLTFELPERLSAEGEVLIGLDDTRVREVLGGLAGHDVEAIAVTLLWSVVNPVHEQRVAELIEELLPGMPYTLSHRANPVIREYRRAAASAIDASLKPLMRRHLHDLRADLLGAGYGGELMIVTSEGGVLDVDSVAERPILAVNSGPSMAPLAGASFAGDAEAVVVCDMGGTTFDVSLVEHGTVRHTRDSWLGEPFLGELTGLSSVAVKSIGAGGGSIAWIDPGGLLRVGPQSAGSAPGPAAYGRGGTAATITDAAVVLGYLDATGFAGGFALDCDAASDAVLHGVAAPLGLSVEAAADAIFKVAANQMATAIRQATLEEGVDPRGTVIVAGGGAGPMLASWLADVLDCSSALIPRTAGVLAAYGAHRADIATEFTVPDFNSSRDFEPERLERTIARLDEHAAGFFERFGAPEPRRRVEYWVEARYPAQAWDLRVPLAARPGGGDDGKAVLVQAFHDEHDRRNGIRDPESAVEFLAWGLRASIAREPGPAANGADGSGARPQAPAERRVDSVLFGRSRRATPRYAGADLGPGTEIEGPLVVDEVTTTVVVPPSWSIRVDEKGSFHLERKVKETPT
jgi:N-methylhydantoinase A